MSTDTNLSICTGWDINKALLSRLITDERTRQLLEIMPAERDYRVTLSEENLMSSRLWEFFRRAKVYMFSLLIWFCLYSICDMRSM